MNDNQEFYELLNSNLSNSIIDQHEFMFEAEGFKVYRKTLSVEHSLYEYKAIGVIKTVASDLVYKVYMDNEFRKKYDSAQGETRITNHQISSEQVIPKLEPSSKLPHLQQEMLVAKQDIEWTVKYPWPMKDRLYYFDRECRLFKVRNIPNNSLFENSKNYQNAIIAENVDVYAVKCESLLKRSRTTLLQTSPSVKYPNHVHIEDYNQSWIFFTLPEGTLSTNVIMIYFENTANGIPATVLNWGLQRGIPGFIKSLSTACVDFHNLKLAEDHKQKQVDEKSNEEAKIMKTTSL